MKENYQNQLFRLAAILYADNNYDIKTNTIYKKIIESILLECGKRECTLHHIVDYAKKNYNLTIEEEHIKSIVTHPKQVGFLVDFRNENCYIALDQKRKQTIEQKISNKTIEHFIIQFEKENSQLAIKANIKEVIYRFLYEIFSTNTASFTKLINKNKEVTALYEQANATYSDTEKEIINSFLHWDNGDKNKAIFDISSYSLEYCMLTNNNGASSIHIDNLRYKTFYLDTNVIYRALGINGDDRKNRSRTFLQKFLDSKEQLLISKITEEEFKEGIKSKIRQIKRYNSPRIKSESIENVEISKDVYSFYHKWRIEKTNTSLELFEAYIFTVYETFKKDFKIELEYQTPYDNKDKEVIKTIGDYASGIQKWKDSSKAYNVGCAFTDAENIYWIETKRNGNVNNIFDTKFFFISTDQSLRRWDYQRSNNTPLVLLPSQWMSILLRYFDCSDNDYKSFVSFLNLKNNEKLIDSNKLQVVLAGISEITESIQDQRMLINTLINKKFTGIIEKNSSDEDIFKNAKQYAESELERQVKELGRENRKLSDKHRKLSSELKSHKETVETKITKLEEKESQVSSKYTQSEKENKDLKKKLLNVEVEKEIKKWQRPAKFFWIPLCLVLVFIFLLSFLFQDKDWNFVKNIIESIDSETSVTKQWLERIVLNVFVTIGIIGLIKATHKRLGKQNVADYRDKIKTRIKENAGA